MTVKVVKMEDAIEIIVVASISSGIHEQASQ
jgi:hypothetical protein